MTSKSTACLACREGTPRRGHAQCPACGHVFRGRGWDGIDAHWKAHHLALMTYEEFFSSLCPAHRAADSECPCCAKGIPEHGPRQCPECALVLRGKGWAGMEAHWQAHHLDLSSCEEFFSSLCRAHRADDHGMPYLPFTPARPGRRSRE